LALLHLYDVSGDPRHLGLARFFLEERGREPYFFHAQWEALGHLSHWTGVEVEKPNLAYFQSHLPVRQQSVAVGHAVRAVYLYAAMADLARRTRDAQLVTTCELLWRNITQRQMYVTGAVGSTHLGEAFTFDYDLPNETAYAETCASIGLIFFAQRMLQLRPAADFADVTELALYNTVLGSMSLDGRRFLYVNPLETWPAASQRNPDRKHVKSERQAWFGCACCPPNLARLLMSLDRYVCDVAGQTLFIHQYMSGTIQLPSGTERPRLDVETGYPNDGQVRLRVCGKVPADLCLALRIPGWCRSFALTREGKREKPVADPDGYLRVRGPWQPDEQLMLEFVMEVEVLEAHPQQRANAGRICLRRGPLVYCLESVDNGDNLSALTLDVSSGFETRALPELLPGSVKILAKGWRRREEGWDGKLYRVASANSAPGQRVDLVAVPYHLRGNRDGGEMSVWVRRSEAVPTDRRS
jgi:DUF1680 family protein